MRKILLVGMVLLAACGKKKVPVEDRYYSLVLEATELWRPQESSPDGPRVDLIRVTLPDFLMSRNLAIQVGTNEVKSARHHYWAEPLDEAVRKVLVWDLSAQLPEFNITRGLGRNADCILTVEFDRLHVSDSSQVLVSGRYAMRIGDDATQREFDVSMPLRGDGYTSAVATMRRSLAKLSEEMRSTVQGCSPQSTPASAD